MSGVQIAEAFVKISAQDNTKAGIKSAQASAEKSLKSTSATAKATMSTVFGSLKGLAGSALAPVLELSEGMARFGETVEEHGKSARAYMLGIGAAGTAVGGLLMALGSQEQAAQNQLKQAVANTGQSWEDYEGKIEKADKANERFGYTAVQTDNALQILVSGTHDTSKALSLMGETADLAAAKHESLDAAATQITRVLGGKGGRTLAQYNIALVKNADGTTNWTATNEKLAQVLKGQASAAADTFTGKIHALTAAIEDNVAAFGSKYGPAITGISVALLAFGGVGPVFRGLSGFLGKFKVDLFATAGAAEGAAVSTVAAQEAISTSAVTEAATVADANAAIRAALAQTAAASEESAAAQVAANNLAGESAEKGLASRVGMGAANVVASLGAMAIAAAPLILTFEAIKHGTDIADGVRKLFGTYKPPAAQPVEEWVTALEKSGGALDSSVRSAVREQIEQDGLAKAFDKSKLSAEGLTEAVTGTQQQFLAAVAQAPSLPAYDKLFKERDKWVASQKEAAKEAKEDIATDAAATDAVLGDLARHYGLTSDAAGTYAKAVGIVSDGQGGYQNAADGSVVSSDDLADAIRRVRNAYADASTTGSQFLDQLTQFSQSQGTASDRAQLMGATIMANSGATLDNAKAVNDLATAYRALRDDVGKNITKYVDQDGAIRASSYGSQKLIGDLENIRSATIANVEATYQNEAALLGRSRAEEDAYAVYQKSYDALVKQAEAEGLSATQAKKLADATLGIPKDVKTQLHQEGVDPMITLLKEIRNELLAISDPDRYRIMVHDQDVKRAQAELNRLNAKNYTAHVFVHANTANAEQVIEAFVNRPRQATVHLGVSGPGVGYGGKAEYNAAGGYISGPGTGTSDSIPSWLSNGEFVVNAAQTKRNRRLLEAINSGMPGFAKGGPVGESPQQAQARQANERQLLVTLTTGDAPRVLLALFGSYTSLVSATKSLIKDAQQAVTLRAGSQSFVGTLERENDQLLTEAQKRESVAARLTTAQTTLANLVKTYQSEESTVASAVTGSFNISTAGSSDTVGSTDRIIATLQQSLADAKAFRAELKTLKRAGLSNKLLAQLAEAGPDSPNALALAHATVAQIKEINNLSSGLDSVSTGTGKDVAEDLYRSGLNAAHGLVDGLKHEEAHLDAQMKRMADIMVNRIKTDLAIHSPSQVMHELGAHTGQGFANGLQSKFGAIDNATGGMSHRATRVGTGGSSIHIDHVTLDVSSMNELNTVVDLFSNLDRTVNAGGF